MYSNVGKKIKTMAVVLCVLGIILSVVIGISMIVEGNDVIDSTNSRDLIAAAKNQITLGVGVIIVGPIAAWIASLLQYGFGVLVENSTKG